MTDQIRDSSTVCKFVCNDFNASIWSSNLGILFFAFLAFRPQNFKQNPNQTSHQNPQKTLQILEKIAKLGTRKWENISKNFTQYEQVISTNI